MKSIFIAVLIGTLIFSCSSKSDKQLFDEAAENLNEEKIPESINAYQNLINHYPESDLAPKSYTQLAGIYHSKKLTSVSELESLQIADSLFYQIHIKYPESSDAPLGLFMAGFIQANELGNFQKATETYNRFLKMYSEHELAVSAKEELENMGLTPEEILKKNITANE